MNNQIASKSTARVSRLQPKRVVGNNFELRFNLMRPWVEGKQVLDVGAGRSFSSLHRLIDSSARSSVALDIDPDAVDMMREDGFEAVCGDAQALNLGETYDVIIAGELIEHLDNYRAFFKGVRQHLTPDGVLILTTPNVFRISGFVYRLGSKEAPVNEDHMVWFCETTLRQLLLRMNYEVLELGFVPHRTPGRFRSLAAAATRLLLPNRLTESAIYAVARPIS